VVEINGHKNIERKLTALEPDREQIEIFVDALFRHRGNEGYLSLRAFKHDNQALKPILTVRLKRATRAHQPDLFDSTPTTIRGSLDGIVVRIDHPCPRCRAIECREEPASQAGRAP
jgi:hypothetical protein